MSLSCQQASQMVRAATRLHRHNATRQLGGERENRLAMHPPAQDHRPIFADAYQAADILAQVDAQYDYCHGSLLLSSSTSILPDAQEGAGHPIKRAQAASPEAVGHSARGQRRLRSRHGGCVGGLPETARSEPPLVCLDETTKQLIKETRVPIPAKRGQPARRDYEYQRNGTANLFMLFAPLQGWRHVEVTDRRTAVDYAQILKALSDTHFPAASKIVLVPD